MCGMLWRVERYADHKQHVSIGAAGGGFVGLFRKKRQKVSAQDLGSLCTFQALKSALDGKNSLFEMLIGSGMPVSDSFYSETETMIFTLFPFDVVVAGKYPASGDAIREAMWTQLTEFMKLRFDPSDVDKFPWESLSEHCEERFGDYITALRSAPGGEGLRVMSMLAYRHIHGGDARQDPDAYMNGSVVIGKVFSMLYAQIPKDLVDFEVV